MHQWSRRVRRAVRTSAMTVTAVWVITIGSIGTDGLSEMNTNDAHALTPVALVRGDADGLRSYRAQACANVLHLTTMDDGPELRGLRLGTSVAEVDADEPPQSSSMAGQVTGVPWLPVRSVSRSAGHGGRHPGSITWSGPGAELPLVSVGSSRLTATARWGQLAEHAAGPVGLSSALARPGPLVLRPSSDAPLLHLWRGSQARTQTQLVAVPGLSTLGVRATARAELTGVTLFRGSLSELTLRFVTAPLLVALAAGNDRTSVRYRAPSVAVTATHGRSYRLDAVGETVEIPLAGPGGVGREETDGDCCGHGADDEPGGVVRLSLGGVREHTGNTSVDATVSALRLQVLGVPDAGRMLDTSIGDLDVSAQVPVGGLGRRPGGGPGLVRQRLDADPAAPESAPSTNAASPSAEETSAEETPAEETPAEETSTEETPTQAAPAQEASPVEQPAVPSPTTAATTPTEQPALPLTGANVPVLGALGLALLGAGWIVLRATRRRRH